MAVMVEIAPRATTEGLHALASQFQGRTAIVFASGPSLPGSWSGRGSALPKIVVNDAWRIVPDADLLHATDRSWWAYHWGTVRKLPAVKTVLGVSHDPGVLSLVDAGRNGYEPKLGLVRHGYNSGHVAVHLAAQLGATRVVLVGFDMRPGDDGREHFFGSHPRACSKALTYGLWRNEFGALAAELAARGIEVVNATPGSALECVPMVRLEDVL